MEKSRILIACQFEDNERFVREVEYLFKSIKHFGGDLAFAQFIAYYAGSISSKTVDRLLELGIIYKHTKTTDTRCLRANKIQMLDDSEDFDVLVALDTDIVVVRDFSSYLHDAIYNNVVMAKPADTDHLTLKQWKNLYEYFGVELPLERYKTIKLTDTIPYFNSGVLIIPKEYISSLYRTWKLFTIKLLNSYLELPHVYNKYSFFTDQFALSLALAKEKIPQQILPLEMNLPVRIPIPDFWKPEEMKPYILHHHHNLSKEGNILHGQHKNINKIIDNVNVLIQTKTVCVS